MEGTLGLETLPKKVNELNPKELSQWILLNHTISTLDKFELIPDTDIMIFSLQTSLGILRFDADSTAPLYLKENIIEVNAFSTILSTDFVAIAGVFLEESNKIARKLKIFNWRTRKALSLSLDLDFTPEDLVEIPGGDTLILCKNR